MKICLINNLYQPFTRGGAERIVELLANTLVKSGKEVIIITTRPVFSVPPKKQDDILVYYLRAFYYNLDKWPRIARLFWHLVDMFDGGSYLVIKSILKKEKPDLVISNNLKGVGFLIPKLINKLKIKHIHICHDVQLLHPSGLMICGREKQLEGIMAKTYARINKYLFGSPQLVIFPSRWLEKMHREAGFFPDSKIIVKSNPAPLVNITANPTIGANENLRFLFVGQLIEHKGVLFLINTFNNLFCEKRNNTICELHIVGDGPAMGKAKKLANDNRQIYFHGRKKSEEVKTMMMSSDVLIVPSLCHENSPNVIYEAASVGLPVVASRVGGTTELVEYLGGLLFTAGNEGDLMHAMLKLATDRGLLKDISKQSQAKIHDFSAEKYVEIILE